MLGLSLLLAATLSRAEILERFKAPVITHADGLVQVYADCPQDLRQEFQMPIASFAADIVKQLYGGLRQKSVRFQHPGIVIHIGEVRTNLTTVVTRVVTNGARTVTRIYVESPGYADLNRLRTEIIKGFYRSVRRQELNDAAAAAAYRAADPRARIEDLRAQVDAFVLEGRGDFSEGLRLMRKIIEPGHASRRDVLTFASRLFLYAPYRDVRWLGKYDCLSFREAIDFVKIDPHIRLLAATKANEMPVFGGGKGESLQSAALAYRKFLMALAHGRQSDQELQWLLETADTQLNVAFEEAVNFDRRNNR